MMACLHWNVVAETDGTGHGVCRDCSARLSLRTFTRGFGEALDAYALLELAAQSVIDAFDHLALPSVPLVAVIQNMREALGHIRKDSTETDAEIEAAAKRVPR